MSDNMEKHPANQIHDAYIPGATARELTVAMRAGTLVFREDARQERRWVKRSASEWDDEDGWLIGSPKYSARADGWVSENTFADALRDSATKPFDRVLVATGWHPEIERRIAGDRGGLDGAGASLHAWQQAVLENKLFAGSWWARATKAGDRVVWVHEDPDDVLDYEEGVDADGRVILTRVVLQSVSLAGYIMRTVFEVEDGRVKWREFTSKAKVDEGIGGAFKMRYYAPKSKSDLILEFPEEPSNDGFYGGISAVPMVCYRCSIRHAHRSEGLFGDAGAVQLRLDAAASHLAMHRARVADSPGFYMEQERGVTGISKTVPDVKETKAGKALPPGVRGQYQAMDAGFIAAELAAEDAERELIRAKCGAVLEGRINESEKRALEVELRHAASMSRLEMLVDLDLAASRRLLQLTARMQTLVNPDPDPDVVMTRTRSAEERGETVREFQGWAQAGLVTRKTFYLVAKTARADDLPPEVWEEIDRTEAGATETWIRASTRVLTPAGEEQPEQPAVDDSEDDDGAEEDHGEEVDEQSVEQ